MVYRLAIFRAIFAIFYIGKRFLAIKMSFSYSFALKFNDFLPKYNEDQIQV